MKTSVICIEMCVFIEKYLMGLNRVLITAILVVFSGLLSSVASAKAEQTGEIVVKVVGLELNEGEVRYGLYDNEASFKQGQGYSMKNGTCTIKNNQCEFTIPNIKYGTYAIMIGHDRNKDGEINKEPYGVSNYIKELWWWPNFDKAKFVHDKEKTIIEIRVFKY